MKIKTPYFILEFEIIFLIVFFSFLFSNEIRKILFSFYICYLFIIFHELSHMFVAAIFGKEINRFKFSMSGVNISFNNIKRLEKYKEILIYLAGPLSNFILAIIFSYNKMIFEINMCFFIINLLPIYPLDGYNIIFNLLRNTRLEKYKNKILKICSNLLLFILYCIAIINIIINKNFSILIFSLYVYFVNINSKKEQQLYHILSNI